MENYTAIIELTIDCCRSAMMDKSTPPSFFAVSKDMSMVDYSINGGG